MDHANSSLARSAEPLHRLVAGTNACAGESCPMTIAFFYMDRLGKENCPLPQAPSPTTKQTKSGRLHKTLDTPSAHAHAPFGPAGWASSPDPTFRRRSKPSNSCEYRDPATAPGECRYRCCGTTSGIHHCSLTLTLFVPFPANYSEHLPAAMRDVVVFS